MKKLFLSLGCLVCAAAPLFAQCDPGEFAVRLEIDPDYYWYEANWELTNLAGNEVYAEGVSVNAGLQVYDYCVPTGGCVVFRIHDDYGDGLLPDGFYRLYVDNVLVHENIGGGYGSGENVTFGCPPGGFCNIALPLDTGLTTTPSDAEVWYSYTPAQTGTYQIDACEQGNACPVKIWVYDQCEGITVTNNNLGTTFYSDGNCADDPDGAVATLLLAGGHEYFIRVGYETGSCNDQPLQFHLGYLGPVVGCTDPTACNYQPLATVSDTCIYPGDPNCTDLPDLVVLENVLRNTLHPEVYANGDACAVEEGCIRGFGERLILRFTTHIKNIGVADYFIGQTPPTSTTPSDQFVWDPCHNHWHYRGYAEYVLFDADGHLLPVGSKNGFCVLDLECSDGGTGKFTCGNMGISKGCGDIYDQGLPCQWVDVTGIEPGLYTLVVRVNWDKSPDKTGRHESNYENNWAQACFTLEYDDEGIPVVEVVNDCPQFTDCAGEVFGSAQPDCAGNCNGTAIHGDLDLDVDRDAADVTAYIGAALTNNNGAAPCNDLDDNGALDVYDAALLQECLLHGDDPQYWGTRFACQFPTGTTNPDDIVYLLPGTLDTEAKTFDIQIVNPYSKLYGLEFNISGLTVTGMQSLDPAFGAIWHHNASTGELLALTTTEEPLKKNILPTAFLRVHYDQLTAEDVCVSNITAIVNEKYLRSNALLADPNCVEVAVSSVQQAGQSAFRAIAVPNPASEQFTLFFDNPSAEAVAMRLTDAAGRTVYRAQEVRGESLIVDRGALPAGVYLFRLESGRGVASGKVVLK